MIAKKKKVDAIPPNPTDRKGFSVDFSRYLHRHYDLDDIYAEKSLLEKVLRIFVWLSTAENPTTIQSEGYCRKIEKLNPKQDQAFFKKANFILGQMYYLEFGNNGYGIVLGIDSSERIAYCLALDTRHRIRAWHGKFG